MHSSGFDSEAGTRRWNDCRGGAKAEEVVLVGKAMIGASAGSRDSGCTGVCGSIANSLLAYLEAAGVCDMS